MIFLLEKARSDQNVLSEFEYDILQVSKNTSIASSNRTIDESSPVKTSTSGSQSLKVSRNPTHLSRRSSIPTPTGEEEEEDNEEVELTEFHRGKVEETGDHGAKENDEDEVESLYLMDQYYGAHVRNLGNSDDEKDVSFTVLNEDGDGNLPPGGDTGRFADPVSSVPSKQTGEQRLKGVSFNNYSNVQRSDTIPQSITGCGQIDCSQH